MVAALQFTLIVNHQFSNQNTGLQQETPSQYCDCLRLWQLHIKTLCYFWTPAICIQKHEVRLQSPLLSSSTHTSKFVGYFRIRKYCFEQKSSPLSHYQYDVSHYEMNTHLLPLIQFIWYASRCSKKNLSLLRNSFNLQQLSCALHSTWTPRSTAPLFATDI